MVLGCGVALLAVSTAERKPATARTERRRGTTTENPTDGAPATEASAPADPDPVPAPTSATQPAAHAPERPDHDVPAAVSGPARRARRPRGVPAAQAAVEGRYADVARASLLRRVLSLVGIIVIVVVVGVLIALLFGAVVGAAAEMFGNTIG